MQRIENQIYRTIAQIPTFIPIEGLRAQIGASSCKARDIKSKIDYAKYALRKDNNLVRVTFLDAFHSNKKPEVIKPIKLYMQKLNVNLRKIESMTTTKIKETVNKCDTENWLEQVQEKSTLRYNPNTKEKSKKSNGLITHSNQKS